MRPSLAAFLSAVFLLATSPADAKVNKASCAFTTFSAPSGYSIAAVGGIDDNGNVVGQLMDKGGNVVAFTRSSDGSFTTYQAPKSYMTTFSHRLNSGVTVGTYEDKKLRMHGLMLTGGKLVAINYPSGRGTWLYGINKAETVVGGYLSGAHTQGFEFANGTFTSVSYPGGLNTELESINDNGLVVGYYQDATLFHGITWQNGKFQVIDYPASKYGTILSDVNQSGVIVGNQFSADFAFGFFYNSGRFTKIVYNGAKAASIGGINNSGVISGQIFFKGNNQPGYTAVCKY